jgi:hypothetical protein
MGALFVRHLWRRLKRGGQGVVGSSKVSEPIVSYYIIKVHPIIPGIASTASSSLTTPTTILHKPIKSFPPPH